MTHPPNKTEWPEPYSPHRSHWAYYGNGAHRSQEMNTTKWGQRPSGRVKTWPCWFLQTLPGKRTWKRLKAYSSSISTFIRSSSRWASLKLIRPSWFTSASWNHSFNIPAESRQKLDVCVVCVQCVCTHPLNPFSCLCCQFLSQTNSFST